MTATTALETVAAEDAPIGVQLWPTYSPDYAPNFTLAEVQVVRSGYQGVAPDGTHHDRYVRWVYVSGTTRTFRLGERVTVKFP